MGMSLILLLVIAFIPGLLWLSYIRYQDRAAPEPMHLVALVFFLGMAAILPASLGNNLLEGWLKENFSETLRVIGFKEISNEALTILRYFVLFFFIIGPIEELSKFLVVRLSIYYHPEFNEPIDALVYCAAAALGFASLENVLYALQKGHGVLYLRALLSVPGHVAGQLALWLDLPATGPVLLVSDAISRPAEITERFDTADDPQAAIASAERLLALAAETGAWMIYGHCPAQWPDLKKAPELYL